MDLAILGPDLAADLLQDGGVGLQGGLAAAVDLVSRHPAEVGAASKRLRQLLHAGEVVRHDHCLERNQTEPKLKIGVRTTNVCTFML